MGLAGDNILYCGPAPDPTGVLLAWRFDPVALAVGAAILAAVLLMPRQERGAAAPGAIGAVLFVLLFVSPICALAVALFSARIVHHVLLIAMVAPLLALALAPLLRRFPAMGGSLAALIHAAVLWLWHAPGIYEWAVVGALPYWTMQLTLLASAMLVWRAVLDPPAAPFDGLAALFLTIVQMGMLGALLTFAGQPLYAPHFLTTQVFGLTPVEDQQLAGLIMWVPAALPYLAVAVVRLHAMLGRRSAGQGGGAWSG